jgi:hypothetical protein
MKASVNPLLWMHGDGGVVPPPGSLKCRLRHPLADGLFCPRAKGEGLACRITPSLGTYCPITLSKSAGCVLIHIRYPFSFPDTRYDTLPLPLKTLDKHHRIAYNPLHTNSGFGS